MAMKKVLMIANQFPPMGGSGVQRTSKFVKYLRTLGWEPVVFTRAVGNMPLKDDSLLKEVPKGTEIIRTKPFDLSESKGMVGLMGKVLHRKVLIPDGERLWQIKSEEPAKAAVKKNAIDLIYSTSYPYSDHLLGLKLKKEFPHIPWVADFRDEWTNNPYLLDNPHYGLRSRIEKAMERKVLEQADILITNTPIMMKNFVASYPETESKFYVIPNGFDETDFSELNDEKPQNEKFTITYTGSFYGRRKPDVFFKALQELITEGKMNHEDIRVQLIGNYIVKKIDALIEKYNLKGIVQILPYMKHKESIQELLKSDALLLIIGAGPGAEAFYTGKVFEYMKTGRPILAIVPEKGVAADVIKDTKTGYVSDCADVSRTKEHIIKLYDGWKNNKEILSPDWNKVQRFDRKELTKDLVKLFDQAIDQ